MGIDQKEIDVPDLQIASAEIHLADESVTPEELMNLAIERTRLSRFEDVQGSIQTAVSNTMNPNSRITQSQSQIVDSTPDEIFEDLKELREKKHLYVIKVDGKIAGCVGIADYDIYKSGDGRQYWTITRAVVSSEYRRRGLYNQLADFAEKQILKEDPRAIIWRVTSEPIVKNRCRKLPEWEEVDLEDTENEFAVLRQRLKGIERLREQKAHGDVYFIYDPLNSPPTPSSATSRHSSTKASESPPASSAKTTTKKPSSASPKVG